MSSILLRTPIDHITAISRIPRAPAPGTRGGPAPELHRHLAASRTSERSVPALVLWDGQVDPSCNLGKNRSKTGGNYNRLGITLEYPGGLPTGSPSPLPTLFLFRIGNPGKTWDIWDAFYDLRQDSTHGRRTCGPFAALPYAIMASGRTISDCPIGVLSIPNGIPVSKFNGTAASSASYLLVWQKFIFKWTFRSTSGEGHANVALEQEQLMACELQNMAMSQEHSENLGHGHSLGRNRCSFEIPETHEKLHTSSSTPAAVEPLSRRTPLVTDYSPG
ncbi:hypothetical protein BJ166DRAFT_612444 [Pestalotiopsis sp. NC0098]|nr:hypothetical protein BJ166DRAFT_612444 [Pestalotiopsis sp. NC0098]